MMRRALAIVGLSLALVGGALTFTAMPASRTEAATGGPTFVVPANDGYGIAECVDSGSACGQVMADAYCEAQGFRRSSSYGPADVETTGSIGPARRPFSITCAP